MKNNSLGLRSAQAYREISKALQGKRVMRYNVHVCANGVIVTDTETRATLLDVSDVSVTVDLDGGSVELYDNLHILQQAFDEGQIGEVMVAQMGPHDAVPWTK